MFAAILLAASLTNPDVHECIQRVLKAGGYGHLRRESAAFLIARDEGFECRPWPRDVYFHAQTWRGRMPENVAAIVHSHPADLPEPSLGDALLAKRLGIPVLVVTPRGVTRADPLTIDR